MTARHRHPGWFAAALLAVLMLSCAVVRSTVMQAAMAAEPAMPMCDGGTGMASMQAGARGEAPAKSAHAPDKRCPYCAAAAHPPLTGCATPLRSSASVAFVAYRVSTLHGPRGPPSRRPRARDPPAPLQSL